MLWCEVMDVVSKKLERHFKGVANHHRLAIILLLEKHDGLTLDKICEHVQGNPKTLSGHTRRLVTAGLLNKEYEGLSVHHSLSPYGKKFARFARSLA